MKKLFAKTLLFSILLLSASVVQAQITITGVVKDEKGETLPGANILIKGTGQGTITNYDGNYSIVVKGANQVLEFSYIGCIKHNVKVTNQKVINVTLKEEATNLNEIVIVGYQEVRRRDLTGSVSKANVDDMLKITAPSFTQSLGGRIAGVNVSSAEGSPGGQMNIVIRGNNSLTQENSPLYVIDGFPVEDAAAGSSINPSDIESIDILKDASAAAIYGARGANGVVMITTKKGVVGKPMISYSGTVGAQRISKKMEMMDAYEFVKLQAEMYPDDQPTRYFREWEGKTYTLEDYRNTEQFRWQDRVFEDAMQQNHSLTLTGGTTGIRYNASLSYFDQDGILLRSNFNRLQGRLGITIRKEKLNMSFNTNYSRSTQNGNSPSQSTFSGMNNLFYSVWGYRPVTYPGVSINSLLDNAMDDEVGATNDYRFNPYKSLQNEYRKNVTSYNQFNGFAEYQFIKGLKLKVYGAYTTDIRQNETFNNSDTRYGSILSADRVNAGFASSERQTWTNENTLTYQTNFKQKHFLNLLGGLSFQSSDFKAYALRSVQIPNESLGMAGLSQGTPSLNKSDNKAWTMMSYFARATYNYRSRYYVTASFRADGSSKFRGNNRFGYFPSASLAWSFTEEDFWVDYADILNAGKLRVSWGTTGNNRVGEYDTYARLDVLQSVSGSYHLPEGITHSVYPFGNVISSNVGTMPYSLANKDLKWETTAQWNLGLDLQFLKDRIGVTVDVYRKNTYDLLLRAPLPFSSGYGVAMKNIGQVQNQGVEFTLNTTNIKTPRFKWTSSFNIAFNQNKVIELAENQVAMLSNGYFDQHMTSPNYIAKVGYPMGMMYGYIFKGTYKYDDFMEDGKTIKEGVPIFAGEKKTKPGYPKYEDINKDGVINSDDQTMIGKGEPLHIGGFTNNFTYRDFDLSIFFQWSYGNDILNANRLMFESSYNKKKDLNQFASFANRWTPENPNSDMPGAVNSPSVTVFSNRVIEDGSFLRLKNITFGYSIPRPILAKVKISSLRVFASADNLYTWTSYTGYDPEVSIRNGALTPGLDFSAYPRAISLNIGANITF